MNVNQGNTSVENAWSFFKAGSWPEALGQLLPLVRELELESPEFQLLVELLRDAGGLTDAANMIQNKLELLLEEETETIDLRVRWQRELFVIYAAAGPPVESFRAGISFLEGLAVLGDPEGWDLAHRDGLIKSIESTAAGPRELLSVLEQIAFAPEVTGLPATVVARIEEIGHANAGDAPLAREVEVLLHGMGATAAAYRVEGSKRHVRDRDSRKVLPGKRQPGLISGRGIVIVGGHPALRALIGRVLLKEGARSVNGIPSATEASRVGRDVKAVLVGSDVAVILVRQIAHSTSDQVRKAAASLGIPVIVSESSSTAGVRAAIERWASA